MLQEDVLKPLSMLPPGSQIIVEVSIPPRKKIKFKSTFVGLLPKQFLLIQLPDLNKNPELVGNIQQGVACTIRSLVEKNEGAIIAFVTSIERNINIPAKMIVLSIPQRVVVQSLRKEARNATQLNFESTMNNSLLKGVIVNLSFEGCLLSVKKEAEAIIKKGDSITFSVTDTTLRGVASIKGIVCNCKSSSSLSYFGIKFEEQSLETIKDLLMRVLFSNETK